MALQLILSEAKLVIVQLIWKAVLGLIRLLLQLGRLGTYGPSSKFLPLTVLIRMERL
jgi:hypothetical protein